MPEQQQVENGYEIPKIGKRETGETTVATSILVGRQISEALKDKIHNKLQVEDVGALQLLPKDSE